MTKIYIKNEKGEYVEIIHCSVYAKSIGRSIYWINGARRRNKLKDRGIYLKDGYYFLKTDIENEKK